MKTISIPYYTSTLDLHVDEANLKAVVTAKMHEYKAGKTEVELVHEALEHPIASPRLRDLAKGKQKVVLVTSDHTRAVPSKITLPILLDEIRQGNPDADITILIATGLHRPTTEEEQRRMFGDAIVDHEKIAINNAFDPDQFIHMGVLPSGADFNVNKLAAECDLLVTEGFIEPHFFAGFSGSRKSVLPGIASYKTIMYNHNGQFVNDSHSRAGNLCHNHVSEDMFAAAEMAHLAFVLNVVLNGKHEVIGSFAGDIHKAHEAGCEFVKSLAGVEPVECEIAITTNGGYPLDQNIYQAVKGMCAAEATLPEGGVIIDVAGCADGHGGEGFYHNIADNDPAEFERACIDRPKDETLPDQWTSQIFARILAHHPVIMVTDLCDHQMIKDMHMTPVNTLEEALKLAFEMKGADAKVAVIPDGLGVVVAQR